MLDVANLVIYGAVVSAISFFVILLLMPAIIRPLGAKGRVVPDPRKRDKPMIPQDLSLWLASLRQKLCSTRLQ
jgi:hypothetical protein